MYTSRTGEVSEMLVGLEYLRKEWEVFTPVGHDTQVDLVVIKGARIKRVQVKSVYDCGGLLRANIDHNGEAKYTSERVDVLVCVWQNKIWSIPMEDVEGETTLNFGRLDGVVSKPRNGFDHTKYLVKEK
tara:strand:- start:1076 stop:1462 length:387 start_codon:yes stop_codon:yes gene_type:complete